MKTEHSTTSFFSVEVTKERLAVTLDIQVENSPEGRLFVEQQVEVLSSQLWQNLDSAE